MSSMLKVAWRNIQRNRRRTAATVVAMTIAVFITVGYSAMVAGMLVQLKSDTLDFELGAAQIFAPGYQDRPSIYTNMRESSEIIERLETAGLTATGRLKGAGLVAKGDASAGAFFVGVDLQRDPRVLGISAEIERGEWLNDRHLKSVVIGRKLAHTLGAAVGDEIVVLSQATDGSMANDLFTVGGIFRGLGAKIDRSGVFMSEALFRDFMVYSGGAHQIIIRRPDLFDLRALKEKVLLAAPSQDVMTWRELNPTLATMLDSVSGLINIMFFIVNVAIGIVILNATLMSVFERIKELGVLKALGLSPAGVLHLIYVESMLQTGLALIVGLTLVAPVLMYLSKYGIDMGALAGTSMMGLAMMQNWYAVVTPQVVLQPVVMTLVVVTLAVLYPAAKAARLEPVQAMRHR